MNKFLDKQYKGLVKREEKKIALYNIGKIKEHRLSIEQTVKPNFAY